MGRLPFSYKPPTMNSRCGSSYYHGPGARKGQEGETPESERQRNHDSSQQKCILPFASAATGSAQSFALPLTKDASTRFKKGDVESGVHGFGGVQARWISFFFVDIFGFLYESLRPFYALRA